MQNSLCEDTLIIRPARTDEAIEISALVMRSKSHWPYPAEYLLKCADAIKIDEWYIKKWPVFVGEINGIKAGVFALKIINDERRLDHLWIDLPFIKKGIGKRLLFNAMEEAKKMGWGRFCLAADPYALDFYLKLGGRQIGDVQSRIKLDLFLPHIEFTF